MVDRMKRLFYIFTLLFFISYSATSQEEINNYKYVIVPTIGKFLDEDDQYQTNSLVEFLFNKYGYTALMANEELPSDLEANPCLGLTADVEKVKGGFLVTKLQLNMKDCRDRVVVSSKVGKSKEKDFKASYHEAIREAFQTFQFFEYKYQPSNAITSNPTKEEQVTVTSTVSTKAVSDSSAEIERLKQEVEALKQKQAQETEPEPVPAEPMSATNSNQILKTQEAESSTLKEAVGDVLFAQPIENGFQVVDMEPKKVMILINSGKPDTFIVKGKNAIVYKDGSDWIYASTEADGPKQKKINLKF